MADALLASDQHVNEGFFPAKCPARRAAGFWSQILPPGALVEPSPNLFSASDLIEAGQTLQGYDFVLFDERAATVGTHLDRATDALKHLADSQKRSREDREFREELQWLAENRHKFPGRWIALQGRRLLAEGMTAKEVFSKVSGEKTAPLVIRVDEEDLPFSGW